MYKALSFILLWVFTLQPHSAAAWDAVGHRLTASVALHYLSDNTKTQLLTLIQQHPRFEEDFIQRMPTSIARGDQQTQLNWLMGQAAFWPDIARGIPESEREKYNHPQWHYIDGAWLRGAADSHGNTYVGVSKRTDIEGEEAESIQAERDIQTVMTTLDYNTRLLADKATPAVERAIALCWVLHLMGDIHNPLHAGSLYSSRLFIDGDRGGGRIDTDNGSLHARWDQALGDERIEDNLQAILQAQAEFEPPKSAADWSLWLSESRELVLTVVYTDAMKQQIIAADRQRLAMSESVLTSDYVRRMKQISRQRLGLAGWRLANWFDDALN